MAHLIRENASKKKGRMSELFTNKIFEFTFVSIFADMTIESVGFTLKKLALESAIVNLKPTNARGGKIQRAHNFH